MKKPPLAMSLTLHLVLVFLAVITLTPMAWLIAATFKNPRYLFSYTFFGPVVEQPAPQQVLAYDFWETFESVYNGDNAEEAFRNAAKAATGTEDADIPVKDAASDFPDGYDLQSSTAVSRSLARGLDLSEDQQTIFNRLFYENFAQRYVEDYTDVPHEKPRSFMPTLSFYNFFNLGASAPFARYIVNSFFVTCATVLIQLFFSSLGGFALARYEFRGKRIIMIIMLLTMMIPGYVLLAPLYELIYRMGLVDRYLGLIIPGAVNVFGMFLFRQSMLQIPEDLLEAGRVDGCSEFRVYWSIALPVTRPMIGAFTLIAFMAAWNNFLWPQIILQTRERFTLPIGLNQLVSVYAGNYGAIMAGTFLSVLPVIVLFFILQKEFISGLTSGAVKG